MALMSNNAGEFTTVRNPFHLQTQQKRLRHLRSISVRNLHSGSQSSEPLSRLQCYFTLHTHVNAEAFYQSEKITGSTNPSWQSFDIRQFEEQINLTSKFIVVRVWVGAKDKFRLLILMEVHLAGLHFLSDKLQQLLVKHIPNTVIFGMLDKEFVFINKDQTRIKNLAKRVSDLDLPSSLLPAVVKVEKNSVRNSYTTSSLSRIQTVLRAIKQMQAHARRHRSQIEDRLLASEENSDRLEERENLLMSVGQLRQELLRRTTLLHQSQEKLSSLRDQLSTREETVENDTQTATTQWRVLQEDKRDHIVKREQLVKENALLNLRRRQMLNELFSYIYPITENNSKYFISGVRLPHAEELQGQDENMVAVGLGYSCHLTIKIAQILGLPLRHPMDNRGSKSIICDQVHSKLADKDREFPLYSKGKDKNHFNYGVFLLNKNISQLRYQCSVATLDLRQTLQNLLTLMQKLGVRLEGDTTAAPPTLASTPEGTALSRTSPNGSSVSTNQTPALFTASANGDPLRSQGSRSGQQHSKASDLSEDGSMGTGSVGQPTSAAKQGLERREPFDESEDLFKPAGDDHFFKVDKSLAEDFNASHTETDGGLTLGGGSDMNSQDNSHVSVMLMTASEGQTLASKTFQLLKRHRSNGRGSPQDCSNSEGNGMNDQAAAEDSPDAGLLEDNGETASETEGLLGAGVDSGGDTNNHQGDKSGHSADSNEEVSDVEHPVTPAVC